MIDDTLELDFVFVPAGAPEPTAWLHRHPDAIALAAQFLPGNGVSPEATSRMAMPATG